MEKKPIVSLTYENERISVKKNSLPYLKCVLRLSCVVHGPIYGRLMGFYVNGSLSIKVNLYIERKLYALYIDLRFAESSKAFIFQKFAVKFYFGLSIHIFQHGSSLSLENVYDSWCMHQTGFSSTAVVPQSKFTELCSSVAVVSQSKSTELCSSAAPFDHYL